MARKTTKFEASDYLDSPEVIAAYITEALETGDSAFIAMAIGDVAKAKGMTSIASETGLTEGSYIEIKKGRALPTCTRAKRPTGSISRIGRSPATSAVSSTPAAAAAGSKERTTSPTRTSAHTRPPSTLASMLSRRGLHELVERRCRHGSSRR